MSEKNKMRFGLLGKGIDYSFSRAYFADKFKKEALDHCSYQNFDLPDFLFGRSNSNISYGWPIQLISPRK